MGMVISVIVIVLLLVNIGYLIEKSFNILKRMSCALEKIERKLRK